ncbi:glycosyl transferase possibly involved in lipopolysaccharide synthesis [Gloeocapsa sp. PCC 73106]|nr:glycosyl transferase possibly involved in lipopolysaccharide synthesis [Gloeocapsa sp. PCC 73106]
MTPPNLTVSYSDNNPTIKLPVRVSVLEAMAFKTACDQLLRQTSVETILIDCQYTSFIDSSGVGALVHLLKGTREKHIELMLINVGTSVLEVLTITGLDQALKIKPIRYGKTNSNQNLPETHPSVRSWVKRGIDILGSLVGLAITGILFIPIAIAIKVNSPGPIFFSQVRCGWLGKKFRIWKFRSMLADAEKYKAELLDMNDLSDPKMFKSENDPRITRVGRFLRRTSLDELPQFWNVLKGEMSLVGTRPPTPDEVELYEVPEWQRLNVKPGMTGEWQVKGRSTVRTFEEVIRLDLNYQENWSLKYDLELILSTILILFRKNSGAY